MKTIGQREFPTTPEEAEVWKSYTTRHVLGARVLAVAKTRIEGVWVAYIDAVPGMDHRVEEEAVKAHGDKLLESVARVLFPEFEGLPYSH